MRALRASAAVTRITRSLSLAGRLAGSHGGSRSSLAAVMRFSGSTASTRPDCLADRASMTVAVGSRVVPVTADFWEEVADEKSVRDAHFYRNNTENYVGTVKYPIGLIGPLLVKGEFADREYFVPMATHEGALLASYGRGAKAITQAGGATTRITRRRMLRAPVFMFPRIDQANDFYRFLNAEELKQRLTHHLQSTLNHCKVTDLRVHQTDRKVHLQIGIDSDNAAGQNKVTYAGNVAMQALKEWYPKDIPEAFIEGGFNSGKRVSVIHALEGKGHSVVVDAIIPREVVQQTLHTTPYRLQRFQKMHNRTNEFTGGLSCTAHAANGLAAFYIANGQDPACTAESQVAVTHFDLLPRSPQSPQSPGDADLEQSDLYASMTLNSVIVATVGGGTSLPSFRAARAVTGVRCANELAELCAAVVLGGELSFYAAMESGEFTAAHWNMTHKG